MIDRAGNTLLSTANSRSSVIDNSDFKVFPNPTKGQVNFQYSSPNKDAFEYTVSNILGKVLFKKEQAIDQGTNIIQVDISAYPDGVYFLNVVGENTSMRVSQKIVKSSIR